MLDIPFFQGAKPLIEPHLLQAGEAHRALNCRFDSGSLNAFRGTTDVKALALANAKTIHRYGGTSHWLEFSGDVDAVEGALTSDTESTTYFTGDGAPSMTYASIATSGAEPYPTNRYTLGIPVPINAPMALVQGEATGGDETLESRSYVYTYVSARGEEGPQSSPSPIVELLEGQEVNLSNLDTSVTGAYNITKKRIYRTSTASGDTSFLFVAEIDLVTGVFTDNVSNDVLDGVLHTQEWYAPNENMIGLTSCPNGVLAGFYGKDLYFCEPYRPHAWPYSITLDKPIIGIVSIRGGLVVATSGQPVLVSFTHPSAAAQTTIENPRACVSKKSMVDMGEYAIYATADGLVAVDGTGRAPIITSSIMTKYEWAKLNPSTLHAYRLENWYVAFYQGTEGNGGFAVSVSGDQFIELDMYADCAYSDPATAELYLAISGNIVKWDSDEANPLSFTWRSREVLLPAAKNLAAARVYAKAYPVVFSLYSQGALLHLRTVNNSQPFWLPANHLVNRYQVELSGENSVTRVVVGESMGDVR